MDVLNSEGFFTLALVTDPWSRNTRAVKVTATIHITLHSTQHQSGWIRGPTQRALALKPWTPTAPALTALVITSEREHEHYYKLQGRTMSCNN